MSRLSDYKLGFSLLSDLMGKSHILSRLKKKALPCQKVFKSYYFCEACKNSAHSLCLLSRQSITRAPFPAPCCHLGLHRCSGRAGACKQEVLFIVLNKSSPVNFSSIQDQVWGVGGEPIFVKRRGTNQ